MKKILNHFILIIILLIAWAIASQYMNPLFLPKPMNVIKTFNDLLKNGMLISSISQSFWRITFATLISCVISIPLALLIYGFKILDDMISPLTNIIRYIPITAFYPLLILWIGIDENMKIAFLFCATFFYFLPSMVLCIKDVDNRLIETGYTMGMNKLQVIMKIVLPYTLPSMCQSILMMYGIGWTYIVVAEMTNTTRGLGYIINIGSARGRTDMVFMSIFVIMIISWVIDNIGNLAIKHLFKWKFKKQMED